MTSGKNIQVYSAIHAREEDLTEWDEQFFVHSAGKMWSSPRLSTTRPNGREDYHLVYVAEGCYWIEIAGQRRVVSAGEMTFFDYAVPYAYGGAESGAVTYWIHFKGAAVPAFLREIGWNESGGVMLPAEEVLPHMERIIDLLEGQERWYPKRAAQELREILLCMATQKGGEDESLFYDEIREAKRLLRSPRGLEWSVEELAGRCNLSESRFIKKFTAATGMTPVAYRNRELIRHAQWHLCNTDLSVTEISNLLGFLNPSYLSTLFRKYTGQSPVAWRKGTK